MYDLLYKTIIFLEIHNYPEFLFALFDRVAFLHWSRLLFTLPIQTKRITQKSSYVCPQLCSYPRRLNNPRLLNDSGEQTQPQRNDVQPKQTICYVIDQQQEQKRTDQLFNGPRLFITCRKKMTSTTNRFLLLNITGIAFMNASEHAELL